MTPEAMPYNKVKILIVAHIERNLGISTMCQALGITDKLEKIEFVLDNLETLSLTEKSINDAIGNIANIVVLVHDTKASEAKRLFTEMLQKGQGLSPKNQKNLKYAIMYLEDKLDKQCQNSLRSIRSQSI